MDRRAAILAISAMVAPLASACRPRLRREAEAMGQPFITPENDIERAVVAFADHPTPENEAAVGAALLQSRVYVRIDDGTARRFPALKDGQVNVWTVKLPDGRRALAIYTSKARFQTAFAEEGSIPTMSLNGRRALLLAGPDQPIALNWGVSPHVQWDPVFTRRLLDSPPPPTR
jgi:hypothetical protein